LLTAEALKGFLAHFSADRVNFINATSVARSLGIDVDERKSTKSAEYTNYASLELVGDQKLLLGGTQFEGHAHLMRFNNFRIDMEPAGNYLVVSHEDRPGVVAAVSSALAQHDVNIAEIVLGRDAPRGMAVMLMEVDETVSAELREQIRVSAGLKSLSWVVL
jgi:D-3-phosphoglycerate dehydrogenase